MVLCGFSRKVRRNKEKCHGFRQAKDGVLRFAAGGRLFGDRLRHGASAAHRVRSSATAAPAASDDGCGGPGHGCAGREHGTVSAPAESAGVADATAPAVADAPQTVEIFYSGMPSMMGFADAPQATEYEQDRGGAAGVRQPVLVLGAGFVLSLQRADGQGGHGRNAGYAAALGGRARLLPRRAHDEPACARQGGRRSNQHGGGPPETNRCRISLPRPASKGRRLREACPEPR